MRLLRSAGAALLLSAAAFATAQPVAAAQPAPQTALENLASCLSATGRGDLLLVVDQSSSMHDNDPSGTRVGAAQNLVAEFARVPGLQMDVRVAGFSDSYAPAGGWQPLTSSTLSSVQARVGQVARQANGQETDYWLALDGARADLAARRAARGTQTACQVVVWVTDGEYLLNANLHGSKPYAAGITATDKVQAAGTASLCNSRHQGPVNALRAQGVFLIGVGFGTGAGSNGFALMQGLTTGRGGTYVCGTEPTPPTGTFLRAANVDDLVFALHSVANPRSTDLGKAALSPGASLTKRIVLDASVRRATILAGTDLDGVTIELAGPRGDRLRLPAPATATSSAAQAVGPVAVHDQWLTPRTVQLVLDRPANLAGWSGVWSLVFRAPAGTGRSGLARATLDVEGDLRPEVKAPSVVRSNDGAASLRFGIVRADGSAVRPTDILGTARFSAALQLPGGSTRTLLDGAAPKDLTTPVPLHLDNLPPGQARITMTLTVTTAPPPSGGAGTTLAPEQAAANLTIDPPAQYGSVAPMVHFGRIEGTTPGSATLTLTGPGCFWVGGSTVDAQPDGVSRVDVTAPARSARSCVRVAKGGTSAIRLTARPAQQGNGSLHGELQVVTRPLDGSRTLDRQVAFDADMEKRANQPVRWAVLVGALVLGLGLPPAFLLLLRWAGARIPMGTGGLFTGVLRVRVRDGDVTTPDGSPLSLSGRDLRLERGGDAVRELALSTAPGLVLRARGLGNPFTAPDVAVTSTDGRLLVTDTDTAAARPEAALPLAVQGHWVAWAAPGEPDVVQVLVLVPGAAEQQHYDSVVRGLRDGLPRAARALAAAQPTPAHVGAAETRGQAGWAPTAAAPGSASPADPAPGWGRAPGSESTGWHPSVPGDNAGQDRPRASDDW